MSNTNQTKQTNNVVAPKVLTSSVWDIRANKYTKPKVNDRGGKSITILSKQTTSFLNLATPMMMTWGISDFVDEKTGVPDGKFSLSLNFPNDDYRNPSTDEFLQKLKDFESQILADAVENSESWWGEPINLTEAKFSFFPILKYSKIKDSKKIDTSKPPSIRIKVPFYDDKWGNLEIYDPKGTLIFPNDDPHSTPACLIPKLSHVACVIQCGGIWIGGKGWGITWKLLQAVVKVRDNVTIQGKCHIPLGLEFESSTLDVPMEIEEEETPKKISTFIESDSEGEEEEEVTAAVPEPPVIETPVAIAPEVMEPPVKKIKKIVKK